MKFNSQSVKISKIIVKIEIWIIYIVLLGNIFENQSGKP